MNNANDTLARQRISRLLDEKSFMEIGAMVSARSTDFNLNQIETPSDGVITGYGLIDGNLVYVYSQDMSVLNGSIGEMHSKKIAAIYDMAMKMGAPIIGFIDCAGIRLQESVDALHGLGEIYSKQAMASGMIPQICAVFGNCGGGLSVLPALSDFTFVETNGKIFVNSPNAISGNSKEKCDTSSAEYQSRNTGIVDEVGTTEEIINKIRELICILPGNCEQVGCETECSDDLNRICNGIESIKGDTGLLLSHISDENMWFETKKDYAREMVTGFVKLNGMTVGAIGNRTEIYGEDGQVIETFEPVLTADGCNKAAEFVRFCDAFNIPVLSLTNVEGYKACLCAEKRLAVSMAKLTRSLVVATVPKVNVLIGNAYGSPYVIMNSKAIGADLVYAWDSSKIGMMDAKLAAQIMYEKENVETQTKKAEEFDALQQNVLSVAKRGYVDLVIAPENTRKYVVAAFEMLYTKSVEGPMKKHGAK